MRDISRISNFMGILEKYWQTYYPDWRFGQLINNLQRFAGNDLFYYEEDDFIELLEEFFGEKV